MDFVDILKQTIMGKSFWLAKIEKFPYYLYK